MSYTSHRDEETGANMYYGIGDYAGETVILNNEYTRVCHMEEPLSLTIDVTE